MGRFNQLHIPLSFLISVLLVNTAHSARVVLVVSSEGTNTDTVQAVLRAAGVQTDHLAAVNDTLKQYPAETPYTQLAKQVAGGARHDGVAAYTLTALNDTAALSSLVTAVPNLHILHVTQDIRHVALEELMATGSKPGFSLGGRNTSAQGLLIAQQWAAANQALKKWATGNSLGLSRRYSIVRLEDLCRPSGTKDAVATMLQNADIPFNSSSLRKAVTAVAGSQCPHPSDLKDAVRGLDATFAQAVHSIDAEVHDALTEFDYVPLSPLGLPSWLAAHDALASIRHAAQKWAGSITPVIVTFVSNGYEPILNNWLAWLHTSGVDLTSVLVIMRPEALGGIRSKLQYKSAQLATMPVLEPQQIDPATTNVELGKTSDPRRHLRAIVWLERIRVLYELVNMGVSVIMSDLDAVWMRDAVPDLLSKSNGRASGFDLIMSPGYFPFDVYKQMGVVGCMGFMYANATQSARVLLGTMLREKLLQLHLSEVKFYNDQRVLNEQLVRANIAVNTSYAVTAPSKAGNPQPVEGKKLTTAPQALSVLFLSDIHYARVCSSNETYKAAVVVHCQSYNSGPAKMAFLHRVGLWKNVTGVEM